MVFGVLAYIDPNTGGALLAILVAVFGTLVFGVREVVSRLAVGSTFGRRRVSESADVIVYSDDGRYATTFMDILKRLDADGIDTLYMTQSDDDAVLSCDFQHVRTMCIGKGRKAFSVLNSVKAKVLLSTTPGLDVYGWRRSPYVDEYVHVFHAMGTALGYRMFGLDFYDTLLMSSDVLIGEVRSVEKVRGVSEKQLVTCGLPYFDDLARRAGGFSHGDSYVLFAPSWGKNSLLCTKGSSIIRSLLEAGETVCVRPHPQSKVSDADVISALKAEFENDGVIWNESDDNLSCLAGAKALITDFSGIMFDYSFIFEGRVAYSLSMYDASAYDAFDYDGVQRRFELCDTFAHRIFDSESMEDTVSWLLSHDGESERLMLLDMARSELWQYPYESVDHVCDYIEKRIKSDVVEEG